ncbi:hypothetical protein AB1Y20_000801 [Prymnesium parvum]|uniref:Elongation of fatty acids protein n=1 Tax=Prymnesium parvum TaxID=97485 RepID=A0AB34KA64_PRYPA
MPSSLGVSPSKDFEQALQSPECAYRDLRHWSPNDIWADLGRVLPESCDYMPPSARSHIFNGFTATRWTSQHSEIPLIAVALYLIMIVVLKRLMAHRKPIYLQPIVLAWNFSLSLFSLAGVFYTVPQLLVGKDSGLLEGGWYSSVCSHSSSYGMGETGIFVALFIYSKLAELLDTLFLLLRKSPVILLHWYHHATVLLYCWHAYSVRIGSGLWFAAMNYSVHSLMYFYYGVTQMGPKSRSYAKKLAIFITTLQLLQMVVGIIVTVSSLVYHARGQTCYVNLTNSFLGLAMYSSYFVLFLQLFLQHYVFKKEPKKPPSQVKGKENAPSSAPPQQEVATSTSTTSATRPKKNE